MKLKSPNLRDDLTTNIVIKSLISSQLSCLPHHQGSSIQGSKMAAAVLSTHHGSRREGRKISFPRIPQQTPPGSMVLIGLPPHSAVLNAYSASCMPFGTRDVSDLPKLQDHRGNKSHGCFQTAGSVLRTDHHNHAVEEQWLEPRLVCSFRQYLLSPCYGSGTTLYAGDTNLKGP